RPDVRLTPDHRDPRVRRGSAASLLATALLAVGRGPRMSSQILRTKYGILLRPLVVIVIALAAWEFAARSGLWSPILFPPLAKIALIFLECLYPMTIITYHGARNVNRVLLWSASNMGASRLRTLLCVVLPATLPYIFAALRVALPVALIVAIITEMISSVDGL